MQPGRLLDGIPWAALRLTSDAADESFNVDEVLGFGIDTAADVFEQIVRTLLKNVWFAADAEFGPSDFVGYESPISDPAPHT